MDRDLDTTPTPATTEDLVAVVRFIAERSGQSAKSQVLRMAANRLEELAAFEGLKRDVEATLARAMEAV